MREESIFKDSIPEESMWEDSIPEEPRGKSRQWTLSSS
jgi:hypothetical protein